MACQQALERDPVRAALEAARKFSVIFASKCEGSAPALARRLKEFPQLLLQAGLTPALTFYASKLDENKKWRVFAEALKAVACGDAQSVSTVLCGNVRGEGEGYAHALAVIYAYAAPLAGCSVRELIDLASSVPGSGREEAKALASIRVKFVECLEAINSKGVHVERLVLAYANEAKKLFTALYGEKQR